LAAKSEKLGVIVASDDAGSPSIELTDQLH